MQMADFALRCFWGLSLSLYFIRSISTNSHVYIVYLGHNHGRDPLLTSKHHLQLLASVFSSEEEAKEAMIYSYKHAFSGFAADLNASQAKFLKNVKEVISIFKSQTLELHTTRSWDFMGLTLDHINGAQGDGTTPLQLAHGDDVIVGVIDTGVWPDSASFKEEPNTSPIPSHWKGQCIPGEEFNPKKHCNKKLIGARYYRAGFEKQYPNINQTESPDYKSARDHVGHGTHTSSTAVGSRSNNADFQTFARGIARGGAPRARLAVYKACWNVKSEGRCLETDELAAFDEAISDGVNVISASFGRGPPLKRFFESGSDIGSFHAMQRGISVVFSAGNKGPDPSLVGNVNPWSVCVAASTVDRSFPTKIIVSEDGSSFEGEGFITNRISGTLASTKDYFASRICRVDKWNNTKKATGKILVCISTDGPVSSEEAEFAARRADAAALIFVEPLTRPSAAVSIIPVVRIDIVQGTKLYRFPSDTKLHILPSETSFKRSPAPVVADFSSRGPSSISPEFLKPDISAPGVNILAAWAPTMFPGDEHRPVNWAFQSGTSMSCPHVSGVVALLKSAHPQWSPAAIRSALITTAYNTDTTGDDISLEASTKPSNPFDIGAGHIDPLKAFDPGLIYDATAQDYVIFLCNLGYDETQIQAMVASCPPQTKCPETPYPSYNVNYPSIAIPSLESATTVKRVVRNVGRSKTAVYFASVVSPHGVEVVVWPRVLVFSPFKDEAAYYVTVKPAKVSRGRYGFGSVTWSDGFHSVRSPLVVQVNTSYIDDDDGFAYSN